MVPFWPAFDAVSVLALIAAVWWLRDNASHIELQILIALLGIGAATFLAQYPSGAWRALGITFLWEFGIVGGFFALLFGIVGVGKLVQALLKKMEKKNQNEKG